MANRNGTINTARPGRVGLWVAVGALLAAAIVPSLCVLWFMNAAMRNERLAVKQRLTDVYRERLAAAVGAIDKSWRARLDAMKEAEPLPAAMAFDKLVRSGVADSVIVLDAQGRPGYPDSAPPPVPDLAMRSPRWFEAEKLEHDLVQPARAAAVYAAIAASAGEADTLARAAQAQARCLVKAGRKAAALKILTGCTCRQGYRPVTGRSRKTDLDQQQTTRAATDWRSK